MKKTYSVDCNIGKVKYAVWFNNGVDKHKDGSDFNHVRTFSNYNKVCKFVCELKKEGYIQG